MANFTKLAKSKPAGERVAGTRADMMKQMEDLELTPKTKETPSKSKEKDDVNTPGSKAYLKRRDEDYKRDLKENPRKGA